MDLNSDGLKLVRYDLVVRMIEALQKTGAKFNDSKVVNVALDITKSCLGENDLGQTDITSFSFHDLILAEKVLILMFEVRDKKYWEWKEAEPIGNQPYTQKHAIKLGDAVFHYKRAIRVINQRGNFWMMLPGGTEGNYEDLRRRLSKLKVYNSAHIARKMRTLIRRGIPIMIDKTNLINPETGIEVQAAKDDADFLNAFTYFLFVKEVSRGLEFENDENCQKNTFWARNLARILILVEHGVYTLADFYDKNPYSIPASFFLERDKQADEVFNRFREEQARNEQLSVIKEPIEYVYGKNFNLYLETSL